MTAVLPPMRYVPADSGALRYAFGGEQAPVRTLAPRQVLTTWTEDCFGNRVRTSKDLPSQVCTLSTVNPVTGPFYVDGAEPGDTLAVHIVSLVPARPVGISSTFPHFGALTGTDRTAMLHQPLEERVWVHHLDVNEGLVRFTVGDYTTCFPMAPMLGTIGVAPAAPEVCSTLTCDAHGGNLDVPAITAGSTVYLGVNVEGAMLSLGDGHACQGDGELGGVAVECAMHVTLIVDVIRRTRTPWPRVETNDEIMSVGCARPLEDAYRMAHADLVQWMTRLTPLDELDALQLVTQVGRSRPGNVVNPRYTMTASLSHQHLRGVVYGDAHHRLRHLAAVAMATGDVAGALAS